MSVIVLVVEDEVKIRELVRRYLEREDLIIRACSQGLANVSTGQMTARDTGF